MKKIASFQVDHNKLLKGIYVSRKDTYNDTVITTIDIRMKRANREPVMNTAELHTIEHVGATFLRNSDECKDKVVYFGPMGCRTGCYLVYADDVSSSDMVPIIKQMFQFIADFEGDIPGSSELECGNYLDQNLPMAKYIAKEYIENVLNNIGKDRLNYPE